MEISREAIRYEILSQTSLIEGESRRYTEKIIEEVAYDSFILMNINEHDPFGPVHGQARYNYKIKFLQE